MTNIAPEVMADIARVVAEVTAEQISTFRGELMGAVQQELARLSEWSGSVNEAIGVLDANVRALSMNQQDADARPMPDVARDAVEIICRALAESVGYALVRPK